MNIDVRSELILYFEGTGENNIRKEIQNSVPKILYREIKKNIETKTLRSMWTSPLLSTKYGIGNCIAQASINKVNKVYEN